MTKRTGYVAVVGRPNVGKSTLINHLIGQKVSITSRKPQTTRHRILGILTDESSQIVFIDTPGLHREEKRTINRHMNRAAASSLDHVDAIIVVLDATAWTDDDELVLERLGNSKIPVILFVNKVDKIADKTELLPHLAAVTEKYQFHASFPGSALKSINTDALLELLKSLLPEGELIFPEDHITDRSMRFMTAEIVREKIMRSLGEELPYATAVEIEEFVEDADGLVRISALILVERTGQKHIVIGKKGERLKQIGSEARADLEAMLEQKVFLKLWVKVRSGWADDERALKSLGYSDY